MIYYHLLHIVLIVEFSSAFDTIVPNILLKRLSELGVPYYLLSFMKAFLTDRQQYVRIGKNHSYILNCDIGAPQGCVLSLFYALSTLVLFSPSMRM